MYQPGKLAEFLPSQPLSYPPEPDATGRILLEAAHLIRTRGHAKMVTEDLRGRLCLIGAINVARHGNAIDFGDHYTLFTARVADQLKLEYGGYAGAAHPVIQQNAHQAAIQWNNAPSRTATEVIAALEDAAFHE